MRVVVALLSVMLVGPAAAAGGDPARDGASDDARRGGEAGLKLFKVGKWQEAYDVFRSAERQFHAPTLMLYMAHCQKLLGKLVGARALYREVADEKVVPGAPPSWITAQVVAREELERLRRRIPYLKITLSGDAAPRARITVDGAFMPLSKQALQEFDPGEHVISVIASGQAPVTRKVLLKEGATSNAVIVVEGPAEEFVTPPLPPAVVALSPEPPPAAQPKPRNLLVPAIVSFGAAAVGLGIGAVTGVLALSKASELRCGPDNRCPAADKLKADRAGALADISTVAFIAGGISVAAGVVLLVLDQRGKAAEPQKVKSGFIRPVIGVGYAGLKGTF